MSAPLCLVIDRATVHAVRAGDTESTSVAYAWRGDDLSPVLDALREHVGAPSAITLVVGLGWLEIAQPSLPPVRADIARAILWRDLDRHFALSGEAAVVCEDSCAFAMPAHTLRAWVQAARTIGPVLSIVTAPQVAASLIRGAATATIAADADERGVIAVRDGVVLSARRIPTQTPDTPAATTAPLSAFALGRAGLTWQRAPLDAQLLDVSLATDAQRTRSRRTWASAMLLTAAVILLAYAVDHYRAAQLVAVRAQVDALRAQAAAAEAASARVQSATAEVSALRVARQQQDAPDAPLRVLAALTRALPRDVVVQRLEWDGEQWRVEGTTDKAPRLVPLLDGDAHFRDVRLLAPSQRFLDIGRQRETFTIGFHTRDAGGARGSL